MTLFLNIATILTVFNISKPVDGEGNEVEPKIEWVNGITSYVIPFFIYLSYDFHNPFPVIDI